jgi:DNA-binding transcriptional ArsR family regulator
MIQKKELSIEVANLLKTIANPIRLQILCCILEKKKNCSELLEKIDIDQSPLSQHLTILKKNQIIKSEKHGKYIFYSIKNEKIKQIFNFLYKICE